MAVRMTIGRNRSYLSIPTLLLFFVGTSLFRLLFVEWCLDAVDEMSGSANHPSPSATGNQNLSSSHRHQTPYGAYFVFCCRI
ncbi:hypothetical protein QBC35DRAFT_247655 [Podospora australis]|uniref:Uncharacterized protein n=1 Tax=Podospora australis TaxID=1536484 RepID=A0AAN6X585_9PEZI|nr:hypothetical protein QBC35DRAFT_247655 [Podospora australis]